VELRALGPFQVVDGATTVALGPKEQLVLARLVAARGRTVSLDVLADVLWGDHPPASWRKTMQGFADAAAADRYVASDAVDTMRQDVAGAAFELRRFDVKSR
jgi:hypothetical protein